LLLIDLYTFTEFEDAMLGILETSAVPQELRILIDRRSAAHPTMSFVAGMVNFFRAHEPRLAGTRAAVLIGKGVPEDKPFERRLALDPPSRSAGSNPSTPPSPGPRPGVGRPPA
jgi:hypothetical protein